MGVLYILSEILHVFLYRIFGYRKKVIYKNIRNSFPEKTEEEITRIVSGFYMHLCDLIVESIKTFTISKELANKMMIHHNTDLLDKFYDEGKSIIIVGGHYGNWEIYATTIAENVKHKSLALYTPLKNTFFDEKMKETRGKFGLMMLSIQGVREEIESLNHTLTATIFASDQSPRNPSKAYWMEFLGQDTGVQFGTEKFAVEFNMPVVYGAIHKISRGRYEASYKLITEDPSKEPYGRITETHTRMLEEDIKANPAHWLWSHKRWKHKRPADYIPAGN